MSSPACCRHCGRPKVNRPRGLCWSCWYKPGVKELYAAYSTRRRGPGAEELERELAPEVAAKREPTSALAGLLWALADVEREVELRRRGLLPLCS